MVFSHLELIFALFVVDCNNFLIAELVLVFSYGCFGDFFNFFNQGSAFFLLFYDKFFTFRDWFFVKLIFF